MLTSVIVSTMLALGCESPLKRFEDLDLVIADQRTRDIDSVTLEAVSRSEPEPLTDAVEEALEEIFDAPPDQTVELSLADVRAAALANNLELKVELFNPSLAEQAVDIEEAKFESTLTGSFRRTSIDSPSSVATEGSQSTIDDADLGVRIPLRTGGTATVNFPMNRTSTNNPFSLLDPAYSADVRFSISQPLLRNAGPRPATNSIRVARYQQKITDASTKLAAIRILANADRAYWRLYAAQRELEVRQLRYEHSIQQLERARRRVEAEDLAEIEVVRSQAGAADSLEAIIIAQTNLNIRRRELKRLMNRDDLPMESETGIVCITEPSPLNYDLDIRRAGDFAVSNRMEMLELELQLAIDATNLEFARNQALPLFTVDYSYSVNGLGTSFPNAYDQVADRSFEDWSVGVNVEIPIGNEAALSRVHRAILTRVQRLATRDLRRQAILQEVYDAFDRLAQNWQRILAARLSVISEGRRYEGEQRQFQQGLRTSTDVLDAAASLADAQSAEVQALADYQIGQIDLAFATGTLLGYGQVRWEPTDVVAR
jgi:outer membrane protein TolC